MIADKSGSTFDSLLFEIVRDCGWESFPPTEKLRAMARISGPGEIARLIADLDRLDDADLFDDAGDMADEYWRLRTTYSNVLAMIGEPAVDPLLSALGSNNPQTRAYAARALGYIRTPRAVEPIIALVAAEPAHRAEFNLIHALGMLRDERAVDVLLSMLRIPEDVQNRWMTIGSAAMSLAMIGAERAIDPMTELLARDPEWRVRHDVVRALAFMKHPRARQALRLAEHDVDERVRSVVPRRRWWHKLFGR